MRGVDIDTNAAICGAMSGAVFGLQAVPVQWLHTLQHCHSDAGNPRVYHPRPQCFWSVDVQELADGLIEGLLKRSDTGL